MGMNLAVRLIHEWNPGKHDRHWVRSLMEAVVRAYAAPDAPDHLRDTPKMVGPEAGPRLMKANAHFNMIEKHSMDQHVEDRDCEVLKCQPVYAPVEAKACEHEWSPWGDDPQGNPYRICQLCGVMENRPAPPSAGKWVPKVGEWVVCNGPGCCGKLVKVFGVGEWDVIDGKNACHDKSFCRPATDAEKYRPGAKVRYKTDDLEITGIVERVDEKMNIKFRYLDDKKHYSYCELIEAGEKI